MKKLSSTRRTTIHWACLCWIASFIACTSGVSGTSDPDPPVGDGGNSDTNPYAWTNTEAGICGEAEFTIIRVIPDMLILLDRSESMSKGDAPLWPTVVSAINTVTAAMQSSIRFGLMTFPDSKQPCKAENFCKPAESPDVTVGPNTSGTIQAKLAVLSTSGHLPCGGTPTAGSLQSAYQYLSTLSDKNPKYVLLTTDGAPNCNGASDGAVCTCTVTSVPCCGQPAEGEGSCQEDWNRLNCLDEAPTYAALDDLHNKGIKTFVLGMGAAADFTNVLQLMATHGGTNDYYLANQPDLIKKKMEDIAGSIASCKFQMDCVKIPDTRKVNFYFDGKAVPQSTVHTLGWDWTQLCQFQTGTGTVEFFGADCDSILNNKIKTISAKFGCPSYLDR